MMKTKLPSTHEYAEFVTELKQRIASARLHAARAVNQDLVLLYWDIGRGIVERQEKLGWGQSVVEILSHDLQKAFPGLTGFSAANLWRMKQFYPEHSAETFLAQIARELGATIPWGGSCYPMSSDRFCHRKRRSKRCLRPANTKPSRPASSHMPRKLAGPSCRVRCRL